MRHEQQNLRNGAPESPESPRSHSRTRLTRRPPPCYHALAVDHTGKGWPETQTEGGWGGPRGPPLWEKLGCERKKGCQAVIKILRKRYGDGRRCQQTSTVSEDVGVDGPRGRTHKGEESLEGAKQGWAHTGQKSRKISSQALSGEEFNC